MRERERERAVSQSRRDLDAKDAKEDAKEQTN